MQASFTPASPYPVRLDGQLEQPSRWLWLIKWLLVIPHYLVLFFLWIGFMVSAVSAFIVVLFSGRYPQALFRFNVGVLQWTWRVGFYAFAANGTDRYPPFTLADVPDYPARLMIDYPQRQRRGLPLIGWWLAGVPQYIVAGVFLGGSGAAWWGTDAHVWTRSTMGLIDLLVLVAMLVLLFRGQYPRSIFDFVLGLDRWVLRVVAYASVMTSEYPPFRLDPGEHEPSGMFAVTSPQSTEAPRQQVPEAAEQNPPEGPPAAQASIPRSPLTEHATARRRGWGPGPVIGVVLAGLLGLIALGLVAAGGAGIVLDQTQRDAAGYLMTPSRTYTTSGHALVSASYRAGASNDWVIARDLLGTVRIRVSGDRPLFVGIAPAAGVERYLAGSSYGELNRFGSGAGGLRMHAGGATPGAPGAQRLWSASVSGNGQLTLDWTPQPGSWRVVVMNLDGSTALLARVSVGASIPDLLWISVAVLATGVVLLLVSGAVIYAIAARR